MADLGTPSKKTSRDAGDWLQVWEKWLPLLVLVMLCVFIGVSSVSAYHLSLVSEPRSSSDSAYAMLPFVVLVALTLSYAVWFIACFTGLATPEKKRQSFRFAYSFTITAFVILMIPVANPWQPDVIGPISLVRGCVLAPAGDEASVPGAIRCSRAEANFLPLQVRRNFSQPDVDAQSGSSKASPAQGDSAGSSSAAASAPDGASAASEPAQGQSPSSDPTIAETLCADAGGTEIAQPCVESHSYPWIVTLGGFNGVVISENRLVDRSSPQTKAGGAPKAAGSSAGKDGEVRKPFAVRASIIQGGFVVPFYVVLLALVGGAVSLARRIPEYQKRSETGYVPTLKEGALKELEVREVVVFQIMQLVSAPFIAVVAFYALSPNTMASAIGLAFLSGFASELVLLQVRGIIEGLQPNVTAPTNPVNKPSPNVTRSGAIGPSPGNADIGETSGDDSEAADTDEPAATATDSSGLPNVVSGRVVDQAGKPVSGATVKIVDGTASAQTGVDGQFSLVGVPTGTQHLAVQFNGQQVSVDVKVAASPTDAGLLTLGAGGAG